MHAHLKFLFPSLLLALLLTACGGGSGAPNSAASAYSTSTSISPSSAGPSSSSIRSAPSLNLSISAPKVRVGGEVTLVWDSSDADSCTAKTENIGEGPRDPAAIELTPAMNFSGAIDLNGNKNINIDQYGQFQVTLSCTNAGGISSKTIRYVSPLPVQKSSYLNAKTLNIDAQNIPDYPASVGSNYAEAATGGVAFADFFNDGSISLVTFTNRWIANPAEENPAGEVHFYRYENEVPVERTSNLLSDTTGCIAPRRLLIADFNNDGRPDVFVSCHGSEKGDLGRWPGESPRILLSTEDGRYLNLVAPIVCYCHGATAADVDGDGNVDVLVSDMNRSRDGTSSFMLLKGDGQGGFALMSWGSHLNSRYDYVTYDKNYYNGTLNLQLIDFDGDEVLDLFIAAGISEDYAGVILKGDEAGNFNEVLYRLPPLDIDLHLNDQVLIGNNLYIYANRAAPESLYKPQIRKYSLRDNYMEVLFDAETDDTTAVFDSIFMMPFNGRLVGYDRRYNFSVAIK